MKRILIALGLAVSLTSAMAQSAVSVSVGQPGFYGRVDIGDAPPPRVIYREPVVVYRPPARVHYEPVYVHVPPDHSRHWKRYCRDYGYCDRPVYFVHEERYRERYAPPVYRERWERRYREEWRHERRERHGHHGHRGRDDRD